MKNTTPKKLHFEKCVIRNLYYLRFYIIIIILIPVFYGCGTSNNQNDDISSEKEIAGVVKVITTGLDLDMPTEIPSGWITFRYFNKSNMTHFFVLEKMPIHEGIQLTVEDSKREVVPVFQAIMDSLISGGDPQYDQLPEWFGKVEFVGGVGLVGPGHTAQTTVNIEPGTYVVECYVKNPGGIFHSIAGMITGLVVAEITTDANPPEPTLKITLSRENGIEVQGEIKQGIHLVAVHFEDQKTQEHFAGFDLHLARLQETTDLNQLADWMNWMLPEGLQVPAPAEFLGGVQEMPGGKTAYFKIELRPGRYAWVSEVPDPSSKKMLKVFTIPE